jgi:NAD(P)H-dependent FMN reductase
MARVSHTAVLTTLVQRMLDNLGCETDLVDLRRTVIGQVDPEFHDAPHEHPDPVVRDLAARAEAAHAFVWATPVYHSSYSGALKNALDAFTMSLVIEKPIALCGNGGRTGATQPTDHLRAIARSLYGIALPTVCVTKNGDYAEGAEGTDGLLIRNREIVTRADRMTRQLVEYGTVFQELLVRRREWQAAHERVEQEREQRAAVGQRSASS